MTAYHIVWNADRTEGFITNCLTEAKLAGGHYDEDDLEAMANLAVSAAAMAFRSVYEDDAPLRIQQVCGFVTDFSFPRVDPPERGTPNPDGG